MATNCILCKKGFKDGRSTIKLVSGTVRSGKYGGFKFSEKQEFAIEGFVHFECMYKAITEKRENQTK